MSTERDLSLSPRRENTRELQPATTVVHFTLQQIKERFDESYRQLVGEYSVADSLLSAGKTEECKDIWRSQVVFFESIFDFFIHEISKYSLYSMFSGNWEKSEKYDSLFVPLKKVETALESPDSKEWFFEFINSKFEREVFLSAKSMADQLNLIGLPFTTVMHRAFAKENEELSRKYGVKIVSDIFSRRNAIAHQNDRSHDSGVRNDISKDYVEEIATNIQTIVQAIFNLATEME